MRRHLPAILLFATLFTSPAVAGPWEESYTEDGVTVSRKEVEGSKLVAFKGDTVMDASQGQILFVLMDNDHRTDWVDRLYTNKVLETAGEHEYVLYQAFALPALFSNRDYVYRGKVTEDDEGVVTLSMKSTTHDDAPETVGIRAELVNSRYRLTPLEGGKTRVEVEIQTDPKGWMPAWLVNTIQKSWPVKTLNGIRAQLDEPFVTTYPLPGDAARAKAAEEAEKAAMKDAEEAAEDTGPTDDTAESEVGPAE